MIFLFWFSIGMVVYVYVGYPLTLIVLSAFRNKVIRKNASEPFVSIIIAAYNEKAHIEATIRNKLMLDYPSEKLEIIVASDGSTDGTDDIVRTFSADSVRLIRQEPRAGKTAALNQCVPQARGDIIVFSDANSIYDPRALKMLASNFNDPEVGYVTGKMVYINPDGSMVGDGCTAFMRYENYLRKTENRLGSIVGVDGGIDAVRKHLYRQMAPDQLPDFVLPLQVVGRGYRVVYEPAALIQEAALEEGRDEYRMRVRVALRAMWALWDMRQLLSIKKYGIYAWQLWSHKILRYGCFLFLLLAYVANFQLVATHAAYALLFLLQSTLYLAAIVTPHLQKSGYSNKLTNLAYYFVLINAACAHAFFKFVRGQKQVLWTPRTG